jgi:hypothetical protein
MPFCKRHNVSYSNNSVCPQCATNQADRPYRGMNKPVILDRSVVKYVPARTDTTVQAELIVPKKNGH